MTDRPFTRRDFLKWAGAAGAAAGGAGAFKLLESLRGKTQDTGQLKNADSGRPKEESLTEEQIGDIRVFHTNDAEHRPVSFIKTNDEQVFFDADALRQAKAKAEQTNERQLAAFVKLGEFPERPARWSNKELVRSLPDDIVSTEELAQQGIEVIPAESVEFYIRRGAFDQGSLLERYQVGSRHRLIIAMVDSVGLTQEALLD